MYCLHTLLQIWKLLKQLRIFFKHYIHQPVTRDTRVFKYLCNITFTHQYFLDGSMFKILMPAQYALFSNHETSTAVWRSHLYLLLMPHTAEFENGLCYFTMKFMEIYIRVDEIRSFGCLNAHLCHVLGLALLIIQISFVMWMSFYCCTNYPKELFHASIWGESRQMKVILPCQYC
jgi:hypothetical protein